MTRRIFTLVNDRLRESAIACVREVRDGSRVEVKGPKRSNDQNAAMWAMLGDIAEQLRWEGLKLDTEEWKLVFLDALRREHRDQMKLVPNIDRTGFVDISGKHSSDLSHEEMRDLLTIVRAFGDQHEVEWSEPKAKGDTRPVPPVDAYEEHA
jgi:hypothetical protein